MENSAGAAVLEQVGKEIMETGKQPGGLEKPRLLHLTEAGNPYNDPRKAKV